MTAREADSYINLPVRYVEERLYVDGKYILTGILKTKKENGERRYSAILIDCSAPNSGTLQVRLENVHTL